jgi:sirohydrochlorin ferrochelatase
MPNARLARLERVDRAFGPRDGTRDGTRGEEAPPLIAVAHGSKDPRAAATVSDLLTLLRARATARGLAGLDVRAAFLDHCAPSLPQVLGSVEDAAGCVVVPLLLTAAYHSKTDIPARIAAAALPGLDVSYADTLGPHPLLLAALERRLAEAGVSVGDGQARARTSIVLAAAGSSDPAANATIVALAARWQADGGWRRVLPAYASAAGPRPDGVVSALRTDDPDSPVAVATYLLAPGYFADKIRDGALGAGAAAVSPALGAAPEVADVVLDRYAAALNGQLAPRLRPRSRYRCRHRVPNRAIDAAVPSTCPPRAAAGFVARHSYPERSVVAVQLRNGSAGQTTTGACADTAHARRRG